MPINQKGIDLIKHFEGLRLDAYVDPVGVLTIGYGHTGSDVKPEMTITDAQADQLLRGDLEKFANGVKKAVEVGLSSNAFAALVSFAFNVGLGNFRSSTLLNKLNAGNAKGASKEFLKWVKGTVNGRKVTLPGLVRRRKAERTLFDTSDAAAPVIAPAEPAGGAAEEAFFYITRPGDTFGEIAERNGLSIEALLTWNPHIADPNLLFPGDLIRFQGAPPVSGDMEPVGGTITGTGATTVGDATLAAETPWYALAKGEIGVTEVTGKLRNNARILEYHRSTMLGGALAAKDETPWCSSFVNWCISNSGFKGTNSAMARSWLGWGEKLETPREGCIVVFQRPRAGPKAGHVGFFVRETAARIRVLGGNQSNQVKESSYGKDDLLGYRWPKGKPKPPSDGPVVEEPGAPAGEAEGEILYLVQPGDTLKRIADRAGVTVDQILAWNPQITNPNRIFAGDTIMLVGGDAPTPDEPPVPAGSPAPWLVIARRETGIKEQQGSARNNPRILEYHSSTTLPGNLARIDETAWCSSFVNWCVTRVGLKGTNSARARSWEDWGRRLAQPREGCIVVFSRPSGGPKAGHVGFWVGETGSHIKVLGGNQSNQVKESNYAKSRLIGYRWPTDMPAGSGGADGGGLRLRPPFLTRLRLFRQRIRALGGSG
jgi:lysozyme